MSGSGNCSTDLSADMRLYRSMLLIREFERKLDFLFKRGMVAGTSHLCTGQEAIPVALCAALADSDYAVGTHRGHGLALAKGLPPFRLMAEILGKADGICGGRGGSQHVAGREYNFLGTNGITGGGLPLAAGAALSCRYLGNGRIVAAALGDGATNQGYFHETLNIASLWKLPILFVCENNLYGMSTHVERAAAEPELWKRAAAYRIEAERTDGNDLPGLLKVFAAAVQKVRTEQRPLFVECLTYRWMGHSKSDPRTYRSREEESEWRARCPIKRYRDHLVKHGIGEDMIKQTEEDVRAEIADISDRAMSSAPASQDTLSEHVYSN